jgi:hypothetical protein
MKRYDGFFTFWWDNTNGKIWMQIDKFDSAFLYLTSVSAGLGSNDIGIDRGVQGDPHVVYFSKVGKKILMTQPNFDYRASSSDPNEKRAVKESFAQSVIWAFTADEEDSSGNVLVDATNFFVRDAQGLAEQIKRVRQGTYSFNESRSAMMMQRTKNFPYNSEFDATITFTGGSDAGNYVASVVPAVEAITLQIHHSFVRLPKAGYQPRIYDIRSGYIPIQYFDYSSPFDQYIDQHYIIRHRLQKKDPNAAISEALEPIVYYLDNGTPEPIRTALLEGAQWWTKAFETAGFKNGFQVKILPDTADPMDIRYNMINWVHRSTRGWSYGNAIVDPRTGEIIKGQVTLGSLRVRQDYLIFTALLSPYKKDKAVPESMKQAALQRLRQLSAHEVGHTIGLMHNYASSFNNRASVMDYPHPNLFINDKGEIDFSKVYTNEIGEWDKRAIVYGYAQFAANANEPAELNKILEENTKQGLLYIADADARAAGGMHPLAHLWDNGTNVVDELNAVLKIRAKAIQDFGADVVRENTPLSRVEEALVPLYNYHRYQLEAACKLIGGMNYSYSVKGDQQQKPVILSKVEQQTALDAAIHCLSPEVLSIPVSISQMIPPRPPGYYGVGEMFSKRTGMSFDPIAAAEALVAYELSFLINAERANRLAQFKAQENNVGWDDVLDALIENVWKKETPSGLNGQIQMQTRLMLVKYMQAVMNSTTANLQVKAICFDRLESLKKYIEKQKKKDKELRSYYSYALEMIEKPGTPVTIDFKAMPPGSPIGCDWDM